MKTRKNSLLIIIVILFVVITSITATFAIWYENIADKNLLLYRTADENVSMKYQIYVPIDSDGERVAGDIDIRNKTYDLEIGESISSIVGYALVGWDGGVGIKRVHIPKTYTMQIKDNNNVTHNITKPPTHIFTPVEFVDYHYRNNQVIQEIEIPDNIIYIANGAFMAMTALREVWFTGSGTLQLGGSEVFALNSPYLVIYGSRYSL